MKLGVALPVAGGRVAIEAGRSAEDLGFDGVFIFDHYSTKVRPEALQANDPFVMLGALCSSTAHLNIGSLVYRSGTIPVRASAHAYESLAAFAGIRLIAGIGIGGREFENESISLGSTYPGFSVRATMAGELVAALTTAGVRTWVGGLTAAAERIAFQSRACLNLWNANSETFSRRARAAHKEGIEISWAGPWAASPPGRGGIKALSHHFETLRGAGASWAVIAPTGVPTPAGLPDAYRRILASWHSAA